jgi:hypothetical protein
MNALVGIGSDASDLAETIERARALLDHGDVLAAKNLATFAYDVAKDQAKLAERLDAGVGLVDKARRLQGDALLIETRAKILIADNWDAAKEAGLINKGRPKSVENNNAFTAAEAGLERTEIHEARKLRDAEKQSPGIVEQAIQARISAGLEPSRAAVVRGIGTRSASKAERGLDFYETPAAAIASLLALEKFSKKIWEPSCGRGAISKPLEAAGYSVELSDLVDRGCHTADGELARVEDFLQTQKRKGATPDIVTNPPFGIVNEYAAHALRVHKPRKMALLLNFNAFCGVANADRNFWLDEQPPARMLVFSRRLPMMHRDGYAGQEAGSQMNCAWFIWERGPSGNYEGPTIASRVDWRDHYEGASDA